MCTCMKPHSVVILNMCDASMALFFATVDIFKNINDISISFFGNTYFTYDFPFLQLYWEFGETSGHTQKYFLCYLKP